MMGYEKKIFSSYLYDLTLPSNLNAYAMSIKQYLQHFGWKNKKKLNEIRARKQPAPNYRAVDTFSIILKFA